MASTASIRPWKPSKEEAIRLVNNEPFVAVPVIAVLLGVSRNLAYEGIKDGSIPSVRVASKIRVPTTFYREKLHGSAGISPELATAQVAA